ncbi:MAG: hypothetical protein P8Y12_05595, partial [Gammaproteobacteria bacterium]
HIAWVSFVDYGIDLRREISVKFDRCANAGRWLSLLFSDRMLSDSALPAEKLFAQLVSLIAVHAVKRGLAFGVKIDRLTVIPS